MKGILFLGIALTLAFSSLTFADQIGDSQLDRIERRLSRIQVQLNSIEEVLGNSRPSSRPLSRVDVSCVLAGRGAEGTTKSVYEVAQIIEGCRPKIDPALIKDCKTIVTPNGACVEIGVKMIRNPNSYEISSVTEKCGTTEYFCDPK